MPKKKILSWKNGWFLDPRIHDLLMMRLFTAYHNIGVSYSLKKFIELGLLLNLECLGPSECYHREPIYGSLIVFY